MHYQRWRQNGSPHLKYQAAPRKKPIRRIGVEPCSIEGCESLQKARGWCNSHWKRWKRYGAPLARRRGEVVDGKRICPGCGVDKPLDQYTKSDGGNCKPCTATARREWRRDNPHLYKARPYVPEVAKALSAQWRAKNPERVRAHAAEYRARKQDATVERFIPAEVFERDGWLCGLCHGPIDPTLAYPDPMSVSLDHVLPLSRGGEHSRSNTQASHLTCNLRKYNKVA